MNDKHNAQSAINWLHEPIKNKLKELNDEDSKALQDAYLTIMFYVGTQEQYQDYKNNYN